MKSMSRLFVASSLALGIATTAQATPITGGKTQLTLTSASTFAMLGATISALGKATLTSATNPIATLPITGGSVSSGGDVIQLDMSSGLEITASPVVVKTTDYVINTAMKLIDADVSIDGSAPAIVPLFSLASTGLSKVPFFLTPTAAMALSAAFGTTLSTTLQIGLMTSSPTVKGSPIPEPATATVIGVALLGLAAARRRGRPTRACSARESVD